MKLIHEIQYKYNTLIMKLIMLLIISDYIVSDKSSSKQIYIKC